MKRAPFYSALLALSCVAFSLGAAGCSGPNGPSPESEARGSLALQAAIDSYGAITDPEVQSYLWYLGARLITGLSSVEKSCPHCDITLLNTREPLAYSPGPGHIVLSSGMFIRLQNEAELAFVIAHEMAHQVLGHHAELAHAALPGDAAPVQDSTARAALEQEADSFAVGLLAVSGYDPRVATTALLNAYGKTALEGQPTGYPELSQRQRTAQAMIEQAKWRPPGTVNRREFIKIQRQLAAR